MLNSILLKERNLKMFDTRKYDILKASVEVDLQRAKHEYDTSFQKTFDLGNDLTDEERAKEEGKQEALKETMNQLKNYMKILNG